MEAYNLRSLFPNDDDEAERRKKFNRVLNWADFLLIILTVAKFALIVKFTNFMDKTPTTVFLFILQEVFVYLMLRLKYVEENKCLACMSCDLGMGPQP